MKPFYLSLFLMVWLYACTSSDGKNTTSNAAPAKKDTVAATDTIAKADTNAYQPTFYKPVVFTDRKEVTVPPYGLDTVKALINKIKYVDGGGEDVEALDEKSYASLSLPEKFTYHMIHPETYSQNCDGLPERKDEANRIYGHLRNTFGEYSWSERQINFFKGNRDSVEQLMKSLIATGNKIGGNFKEAIVEMNAKELIPYLIDYYNKEKKDHYILSILMLLMKNNDYHEFMNSTSYWKLYKDDEYSSYLVYNKANEDLIIKRATNFYNGLQSK